MHRLRDAIASDWPVPLAIVEHSHAEMAVAYQAGASGLPCGLMRRYADTLGAAKEAAMAAARLLVTVEEQVERFDADMNAVVLPAATITAVRIVPGGAYPSYAQGCYPRDNRFYIAWDDISRDRQTFTAWMEKHVMGLRDHEEHLRLLGVAA